MDTLTELVLKPGDIHFGHGDLRLRTLLGSCVAVTLWHPRARIGGMCHFVVPTRGPRERGTPVLLDGRYGDEAMELLRQRARSICTDLGDYEVRMFGAGNQFPGDGPAGSIQVSLRNIDAANLLAGAHGLRVLTSDVGGTGARTVVLDLTTGAVTSARAGTRGGVPR